MKGAPLQRMSPSDFVRYNRMWRYPRRSLFKSIPSSVIMPYNCPFLINPLAYLNDLSETDILLASYQGLNDLIAPRHDITGFLVKDFSLGKLNDLKYLCEKTLLPRHLVKSKTGWEDWKRLVHEVLSNNDRTIVHPRFLRAELRLARLDTIHRLTQLPPFEPYLRHYWSYGSLFRENITLLSTATIFVALVLTAMQVGLATEQLGQNKSFMKASYGFTVFAILGPICAFGLVAIDALWNLLKDLPKLFGLSKKRQVAVISGDNETMA
ncbi:hypothetical protein N7540_012525 [Penicillium herquei]|nr:hypothetical protein N7540_012525 [Penicillium herquei]